MDVGVAEVVVCVAGEQIEEEPRPRDLHATSNRKAGLARLPLSMRMMLAGEECWEDVDTTCQDVRTDKPGVNQVGEQAEPAEANYEMPRHFLGLGH